jgi:hypothetical protein
MESSTADRLTVWGLSELVDLPSQFVPIVDLWSWSLNCDRPTPFAAFLDLSGFSLDEFGASLVDESPSFGALELDYLADALKVYASSPADCADFVRLVLDLESVLDGDGLPLGRVFDGFGWAGRRVATLAGFVEVDSVDGSEELALILDDLDAVDTLAVCVDCYCATANGVESVESAPEGWSADYLDAVARLGRFDVLDAESGSFSWNPCELCGSTLGGYRFGVIRWGADC